MNTEIKMTGTSGRSGLLPERCTGSQGLALAQGLFIVLRMPRNDRLQAKKRTLGSLLILWKVYQHDIPLTHPRKVRFKTHNSPLLSLHAVRDQPMLLTGSYFNRIKGLCQPGIFPRF